MTEVCITCHRDGMTLVDPQTVRGDSAKTICMAVICMINRLFAPLWTHQNSIILVLMPVVGRACNEGLYKLLILYDY